MVEHAQIICWLYFSLWNIFDGSSARIISLAELSIGSLSDKIPIYYKWHYEWHFQNKEHHIWVKVFKNGPSKICGRKPVKFWSDTVCLSRHWSILDLHNTRNCTLWIRNNCMVRSKDMVRIYMEETKDSENIDIFKSDIKLYKPENCPCCLCKLYLQRI